jgi:putative addiction module killer protein
VGGNDSSTDPIIRCWRSAKPGSKAKPVKAWLDELDAQSYKQIDKLIALLRQEKKNLGPPYSKHLGGGLYELRDQRQGGPGYRLYYCWEGEKIVILLVGGDKSSQALDIDTARNRMEEKE